MIKDKKEFKVFIWLTLIGKRQIYTKGKTVHKSIQNHRIHKIENIQKT